jgi:membrane associated rhomboid family serine protease
MFPLTDGVKPRRFPIVNVSLIVANFAVWIFYELPHLNSAVYHASFYPCSVNGSCHSPEPWQVSWFTAMFMHGSWSHILGNMWFLAIFGKNVEDYFGRLRYLGLYIVGGLAANVLQTATTLIAGNAAEARVPMLGASGAIAAVLGAYFLYQLVEANYGMFSAKAHGGGTAFFAHVGGFIFGVVAAALLSKSRERERQREPEDRWQPAV